MLSEMTPAQLIEWEAALEVVGIDPIQRQVAKLTANVLAAFWSKDEAEGPPTVDKVMELLDLGKEPKHEPIVWQSSQEMAGLLGKFVR